MDQIICINPECTSGESFNEHLADSRMGFCRTCYEERFDVFKVQQSLSTNEKDRQVLIYNEDRTMLYQDAITEDLLELLAGEPKGYFYGIVNLANRIVLGGRAPQGLHF